MKNVYWITGGLIATWLVYNHFQQQKKIKELQQLKSVPVAKPQIKGLPVYDPYSL